MQRRRKGITSPDYYQNVDKTITQATECSKLLEAMHVSFAMVTEGIL